MRLRTTVRGDGIELRGYMDTEMVNVQTFSHNMEGIGMVVASPADSDYNPFREEERRELHHFEVEQENARLEAENAKLLATIERIKAARSNHPACEAHPDDDPVTCGWKSAVIDIDRALS